MGFALLEDEQIMRIFIEDQRREAAEEAAEKAAKKATAEATANAQKKFSENMFQKALKMLKLGRIFPEDLPSFFPELTQEDINALLIKLHEE